MPLPRQFANCSYKDADLALPDGPTLGPLETQLAAIMKEDGYLGEHASNACMICYLESLSAKVSISFKLD